MPKGGYLHFALERLTVGGLPPLLDLTPGEWICLTVRDSGEWIQPEIIPHIFDPFFTTKPVGQGTGLSLNVLSATNGAQALQIFDQQAGQIRLIVSDVVMPEMGGIDLYRALRNRLPDIKMLFINGHPMDIRDRSLLESGQIQWLQKPFIFRDLVAILKTMLIATLHQS
jgi:CheY-like chemotaxis protein